MEPDLGLPTCLFATDRNPINRINVYSRPDLLTHLHHTLKRTPEFEFIRASCFGPLFDLPAHRCPISCKLIHALLTRQLITKKKYELWIVFGGQPFHFGLKEFSTVTSLPCGEYPPKYDPDYQPPTPKNPGDYWRDLIGDDPKNTLADIAELSVKSQICLRLVVHLLIAVDQPDTEGWGDWDDEVRDKKVDHLELLVKQGHAFQRSNWHGGDSAEQLTTHNPTVPKREHQKHILNRRTKTPSSPCPYSLRPRQVTPKKKSTRKQKQIHDYLKPLPRDLHSQVNILSKQVETLTARDQKLEAKNQFRNHSGFKDGTMFVKAQKEKGAPAI
ncbi:uncharacterized protein LOC112086639 [Eutrema salsugineum]|uniref:uncharacterized protein LOC112086639 n=1 Tax=Eutrema salsugineum TaxID=72664 RepID=UPI000CED39AE|nr:uncharacterized protein LOC112086639 [Eutrema salsugineum]